MATRSKQSAGAHARRAAREAAPWVRRLARLGYGAKGVVYVLMGSLALRSATGTGGGTTGSQGAMRTLLDRPFGWVLIAVIALGLAGYAVWRFVQVAMDPEGVSDHPEGRVRRVAYAISGAIHAWLAWEALQMATGGGGGGEEGQGARHWTALVMAQPLGRWAVGLAGVGIAAFGAYELYRAVATDPGTRLDLSSLGARGRRWTERFGRVGLTARGVVFGLVGAFVVQAAWQYDSSEVRGLGGALASLREQPYGQWLLGLVAAGLVAHGAFEIVKALYRRIEPA